MDSWLNVSLTIYYKKQQLCDPWGHRTSAGRQWRVETTRAETSVGLTSGLDIGACACAREQQQHSALQLHWVQHVPGLSVLVRLCQLRFALLDKHKNTLAFTSTCRTLTGPTPGLPQNWTLSQLFSPFVLESNHFCTLCVLTTVQRNVWPNLDEFTTK